MDRHYHTRPGAPGKAPRRRHSTHGRRKEQRIVKSGQGKEKAQRIWP